MLFDVRIELQNHILIFIIANQYFLLHPIIHFFSLLKTLTQVTIIEKYYIIYV